MCNKKDDIYGSAKSILINERVAGEGSEDLQKLNGKHPHSELWKSA